MKKLIPYLCGGLIVLAIGAGTNYFDTVNGTHQGDGSQLVNLPFVGGTAYYSGSTNIGNLATTLTIGIGHTLANTNYIPSVSFIGAAGALPFFSGRTPTNFVLNLGVGISGGDNLSWSVIYSP